MTDWFPTVLSALMGVITLVVALSAKFLLGLIRHQHEEAMNHLSTMTLALRDVGRKLDQHLRDHATHQFGGGDE